MIKKYKNIIICGSVVLLIIVGMILLLLLKYDTITCTNSIKEDQYTINNTYKIYYKKDIAKKVDITREVKSKNTTILSFFEKNYKDEFNRYNKEYGGYTITSKKNKDTMTLKVQFNLKNVKIDKLKEKNPYLKDDITKKKELKVDGIYKLFNLDKKSCK